MSETNYILKILNLKDENITFDKNYFEEIIIKGKTCQVYKAKLSYIPSFCEKCGVVNEDYSLIFNGSKLSKIKLNKVSNFNTYLYLKKQRVYCKHCNRTFTLKTNVVKPNCNISNNVKQAIAVDSTRKLSEKELGILNNVSYSTVKRVIDSFYVDKKIYKNYLPKVLGFDEFKSVKSADGAMSFVFGDLKKHKIIDIVEDRRIENLIKYFSQYSFKARKNVKYIVIDMYKPYIVLIKKLFPNAKIITDKFHTIQLISRSLNKTRINIMKNFKTKSTEYKLLKKYWKNLLKDSNNLNITNYKKWSRNGELMTEKQLVECLLSLDSCFKETYEFYQNILFSIKQKNVGLLEKYLENNYTNLSDYMKTSLKTLKEHKDYIINSIKNNYTNGFIEGFNNKIKVIKRISFGYRSFYRFKRRILIISNGLHLSTN